MSKNLRRGEFVLDKLVAEHGLSTTGAKALIQAFDPFHDIPISDPQGWPDVESGASIVRCYKQSVTVGVPLANVNFPVGQNWDLHVVAWPFMLANSTIVTTNRSDNCAVTPVVPVAGALLHGGVTIYAVATGTLLNFNPNNNFTVVLANVVLPSSVTIGSGRLTGYGFEVHNTTSQLNKQGSVVVWRQQAPYPQNQSFLIQTPANAPFLAQNAIIDLTLVRFPPVSSADALLLNGSQQWEAAEGCYVVTNFMSAENPSLPIGNTSIAILPSEADDSENVNNTGNLNVMQPIQQGAPFNVPRLPALRCHPVHQSGAQFTGLSYSSTLTINVNIYYESFPFTSDKDILVLAKPSTQYDPKALFYYSELCQKSPVGVPVKMNGLGEWFASGLKALSAAGPAMSALPGLPGLIGKGLTIMGPSLDAFMGPKRGSRGPSSDVGNSWESRSGAGTLANLKGGPKKKKNKAKIARLKAERNALQAAADVRLLKKANNPRLKLKTA